MSDAANGLDTFRNRLAVRLCNAILKTIASPEYRVTLAAVVRQGLARAAVEEAKSHAA